MLRLPRDQSGLSGKYFHPWSIVGDSESTFVVIRYDLNRIQYGYWIFILHCKFYNVISYALVLDGLIFQGKVSVIMRLSNVHLIPLIFKPFPLINKWFTILVEYLSCFQWPVFTWPVFTWYLTLVLGCVLGVGHLSHDIPSHWPLNYYPYSLP